LEGGWRGSARGDAGAKYGVPVRHGRRHHIGGRLTADVSRTIAATSPDTPSLVVNFPSWIGKRTTTFALGAEGISFLPGYSYMRDLVLLNTRRTAT